MLHPGLPDPINILAFGPEKTELEALHAAELIQKSHHHIQIHKTGGIFVRMLLIVGIKATSLRQATIHNPTCFRFCQLINSPLHNLQLNYVIITFSSTEICQTVSYTAKN